MSQDGGTAAATGAGTAAAGTGGSAQAATTNGAAAGAAAGATNQDWTAGLNDEMRGYVQTKGFKDTSAVVEAYRNYEKLQGVPQERLLKIPENLDSDEGRSIFERLGKPKEKAGYTIAIPKEYGDDKLAEEFRELAYKGNLTQKQAEGLVGWWNSRNAEAIKANTLNSQTQATKAEENLKRDWGNAYDQNKEIALSGAVVMGLDDNQVQALARTLGPDGAMKLLHKFGSATGEHAFVSGNSGGGKVSAEQAKSMISQLEGDTGFVKRLLSGDTDAKKQWDSLHAAAHPGNMSL